MDTASDNGIALRGGHGGRDRQRTLCLILFLTLGRLIIGAVLGLGVDESHYVMYARHPAWGYFDHPPMVAVFGLLTRPFGHHPFWIRLGPVLCSAMAMVLLRKLALTMGYRERAAFFAVVALNLMPGFHVLAPALLPDAWLNVFWMATLLAAWTALHRTSYIPWLATGLAFGMALMSKYHGILLPAFLALFVLTTPKYRHWMFRPHAYLAGMIGLLVFLPNIVWNARNDWISYAFQIAHGSGGGELRIGNVLEAVGGQLAFAGPVLMLLLPAAAWTVWRDTSRHDADRFLVWTSLPVFLFFGGIGSFGKILPHWPFAGWWAGALLLGIVLDRKLSEPVSLRWRRAWKAAVVTSGSGIVLMYTVLLFPVIPRVYQAAFTISERLSRQFEVLPAMPPYDPKIDIGNDLYGWERIAAETVRIHKKQPDPERTFLFCHRFYTTSQIAVYLPDTLVATSLSRRKDQYRLWFDAAEYRGWDAIFIDHDRYGQDFERYRHLFDGGDPEPIEFTVTRGPFRAHRIRFYRYTGFKGEYDR